MEQYFWVFFSPKGRLPRDLYYVYAIPVWAALWLLSRHISMELADAAENGTPAEPWLLVPLALLYWMQACVTSRRLHDCSYTGALPVGIAAVLLFDATTGYFPDMLGVGDEVRENSQSVIDILFFAARIAFRLTCTAALGAALLAPLQVHAESEDAAVKHVLLISVDGMHEDCCRQRALQPAAPCWRERLRSRQWRTQ